MPEKQDIIIKLEEAKELLEEDVKYNYGLIKNEGKLIKLVIEHPKYSIVTETD